MRRPKRGACPAYDAAVAEGRKSPVCDPRELLRDLLTAQGKWKWGTDRLPSKEFLVDWMLQRGPELFFPAGSTLLLLRVVSWLKKHRDGTVTAWPGRRTLAALAGRHTSTLHVQARELTAPWTFDGGKTWLSPLTRPVLRGWGKERLTHWVFLEAGWRIFLNALSLAAEEQKAGARQRKVSLPKPVAIEKVSLVKPVVIDRKYRYRNQSNV